MWFKIGVVRIQSTGCDACILLSGEGLLWILDLCSIVLYSNPPYRWAEDVEAYIVDILQDFGSLTECSCIHARGRVQAVCHSEKT